MQQDQEKVLQLEMDVISLKTKQTQRIVAAAACCCCGLKVFVCPQLN